jgi:hypothetical protein
MRLVLLESGGEYSPEQKVECARNLESQLQRKKQTEQSSTIAEPRQRQPRATPRLVTVSPRVPEQDDRRAEARSLLRGAHSSYCGNIPVVVSLFGDPHRSAHLGDRGPGLRLPQRMYDLLFRETTLPHRHPPLLRAQYAGSLTLLLEEKIGRTSTPPHTKSNFG